MVGLLFYLIATISMSLLMAYVIKADKQDFNKKCSVMFDVKTIQRKITNDKMSAVLFSAIHHFMFLFLAIVYWFRRIFKR